MEGRRKGWPPFAATFSLSRRAQPRATFLAVPTPYFTLIREMSDAYNHRLRLVESARQRDIKPTARPFQAEAASPLCHKATRSQEANS